MTNDDDLLLLQDPQFLMVLIAAIVKKNGGTLPISVKDVEDITTADALGLFKDLDNPEVFVLKIVNRSDYKEEIALQSPKETTSQRYAQYDDEDWEN